MTARDEHFDWEQILDRVDGRVPYDPAFWTHIQQCTPCASAHNEADGLREAMFLAAAREPGRLLIARAWASILEDRVTGRARQLATEIREAAAEVWAVLIADSLAPSAAVRGGNHASPRLLVYETPEYSVSLSFLPAAEKGHADILGQVVPKSALELPAGGEVQVTNRPDLQGYQVSEFGEFRISGVALSEGTRLTVAFPELRIHLGPLPTFHEE